MKNEFVTHVQDRAKLTRGNLQRSVMRLNLRQRVALTRNEKKGLFDSLAVYADPVELYSFKSLAELKQGMQIKGIIGVKKVSIVFARHGIFLENGAPPRTRKGKSIKITPRPKRPWLSATLPAELEAYRQIVEREYGAALASQLQIVVNGVFDSRK